MPKHCEHRISGIAEPTSCMAAPEVMADIKALIRDGNVLTTADARLARDSGMLPITGIDRLSMNDGIIYESQEFNGPQLSGVAGNASPTARLTLPKATGLLQCLVLLVEFPDNPSTTSPNHFRTLLFDAANPDSMRNFYREMSYKRLDIDGVVTDWIMAPNPYSYYTNNASGTGNSYPQNTPGLLEDILQIYTATNSLAPFDANGDGYIDGLFLVHAGSGAEAEQDKTKRPHKIWSHKWVLPTPFVRNGVKAYAYFTAPEDGKLGVFAHEFGHFLGLPDLYDTSYRSRGVGNWCLMGGGSWGGGGDQPTRLSAWCLSDLGWIKPKRVQGAINVQIDPLAKSAQNCYILRPRGVGKHEYFLVENRQKTGRDVALPGSGLAVWHIDKAQSGNSNPLSYMVGLVQADGKRDLEFNRNGGDPGDVFPGSTGKTKVDSLSLMQPKTFLSNGSPTTVSISAITKKPNGVIAATLSV